MSEYVKLTTNFAELIAAAARISSDAEEFTADVERLSADIAALETDDKLGTDHFGNEFRHLTYHQPVDGGDGGSVPANEAAKKAASAVGTTTASLADGISSGMQGYAMAELENQAEISSIDLKK